jgi:hypothetical protein
MAMMLEHAKMDHVSSFLLCIQKYDIGNSEPQALNPTPYTLHPTPYTLYPISYILCLIPKTSTPAPLQPCNPATLQPCYTPVLMHPLQPCTPNFKPYTPNPKPKTLHPTPSTLHPTPYTLHPTAYILHPTPYTPHPTDLLSVNSRNISGTTALHMAAASNAMNLLEYLATEVCVNPKP